MRITAGAVANSLIVPLQPLVTQLDSLDPRIVLRVCTIEKEFYLHLSGGEVGQLAFLLLKDYTAFDPDKAVELCSEIEGCVMNAVNGIYKLKGTPDVAKALKLLNIR